MSSSKLTPFGLCVKTELLKRGMTQEELVTKVKKDTGMFLDNGYLYKILTGERSPQKIIFSIKKVLEMEEREGNGELLYQEKLTFLSTQFREA